MLQNLQKSGVKLLAATARPERAITSYCETIPFDAVTTLNGARTIMRDSVLENPICIESAECILEQLCKIEGTVVSAETASGIYANTDIPQWMPTVVDDIQKIPYREKIYKILASHPQMPVEQISLKFPKDTYMTIAERKLIQVMNTSATKWNGVQRMLEAYHIPTERVIYFGDDNDDMEPMRHCGCGVAVSNALDCVKEIADYVAESNDEDGVARFLLKAFLG
jgi:hydroxymethylpyrimidine pyrophosphatase-like HAD family hydrolase